MIVASPESFRGWNALEKDPSRRARSDLYPRLIRRPDRRTPIGPNHTVPYGTVPVFERIPANKWPELRRAQPSPYDHLFHPGQSPVVTSGKAVGVLFGFR